jgi:hypothetical protein
MRADGRFYPEPISVRKTADSASSFVRMPRAVETARPAAPASWFAPAAPVAAAPANSFAPAALVAAPATLTLREAAVPFLSDPRLGREQPTGLADPQPTLVPAQLAASVLASAWRLPSMRPQASPQRHCFGRRPAPVAADSPSPDPGARRSPCPARRWGIAARAHPAISSWSRICPSRELRSGRTDRPPCKPQAQARPPAQDRREQLREAVASASVQPLPPALTSSLNSSARLRAPGGACGSVTIISAQLRAAPISPCFQAESASNSRAP